MASHLLQSAGHDDSIVPLGVELSPEQDVGADGAREHPGLLGGIGQLTSDGQCSSVMRQLSQDRAEQGGLVGTRGL